MPRKTTPRRRSVGSIRITQAGTYQVRLTGPDGKMRSHGTHRTKIEAERVLARLVTQAGNTSWVNPGAGTEPVGSYIRHWLVTRTDVRDSTRQLNLRLCDQWIDRPLASTRTPFHAVDLSATPLRALTPAVIRDWMRVVATESERRAKARHRARVDSSSSVNEQIRAWAKRQGLAIASTGRIPVEARSTWLQSTEAAEYFSQPAPPNAGATEAAQAYRLLHAGLTRAVKDRLIGVNPCDLQGASSADTVARARKQVLQIPEISALAEAITPRLAAAVWLAGIGGLRSGEIFALRRGDIDVDSGLVHVERTARRVDGSIVFGPPKSRAGRRVVPVPGVVIRVLEEHLEKFTRLSDAALVFTTTQGNPYDSASAGSAIRKARREIGRPDACWHSLRHSAATLAAEAGATIRELQYRLGHSTAAAALIYQHASDGSHRALAERIDGRLQSAIHPRQGLLSEQR